MSIRAAVPDDRFSAHTAVLDLARHLHVDLDRDAVGLGSYLASTSYSCSDTARDRAVLVDLARHLDRDRIA